MELSKTASAEEIILPPNHRLTDTPAEAHAACVCRESGDVLGHAVEKMT